MSRTLSFRGFANTDAGGDVSVTELIRRDPPIPTSLSRTSISTGGLLVKTVMSSSEAITNVISTRTGRVVRRGGGQLGARPEYLDLNILLPLFPDFDEEDGGM